MLVNVIAPLVHIPSLPRDRITISCTDYRPSDANTPPRCILATLTYLSIQRRLTSTPLVAVRRPLRSTPRAPPAFPATPAYVAVRMGSPTSKLGVPTRSQQAEHVPLVAHCALEHSEPAVCPGRGAVPAFRLHATRARERGPTRGTCDAWSGGRREEREECVAGVQSVLSPDHDHKT